MSKELVTAETNLGKKSRTVKDYESIQKGALALELKERVSLRNILSDSIGLELQAMENELKEKEQDYLEAKKLVG